MTPKRVRPIRWPAAGWTLLLVGLPMFLGGTGAGLVGACEYQFGEDPATGVGVLLAGAVAMFLGLGAMALGERLRAKPASMVLEMDPRPPVLLCRPFADDRNLFEGQSQEEVAIARIFDEMGPVVAVGRPSDRLRVPGASRMYLTDDEWRETVKGLMARACLILIKAVPTENVLWEFKTAAESGRATRIAIMPSTERSEWDEFCKAVDWLELPEDPGGAPLVCFDSDGIPRRLFTIGHHSNWWEDEKLVQRLRFLTSL